MLVFLSALTCICMKSKGDKGGRDAGGIYRFPEQPHPVDALQAKYDLELEGFPPDLLQINVIDVDQSTGQAIVEMTTQNPEVYEDLRKRLTIRLLAPDDKPRSELIAMEQPPEKNETPKLWTGAESQRRTKPKNQSSDSPDDPKTGKRR
jgi:hypothetical protein